jgi:cytidylate kinase
MAIIFISRGSYTRGREVAEKVAQRLGYPCLSREVLLCASQEFNIEEITLTRAVENAPSFLNRLTHGRDRYIGYIQAALLNQMKGDNIVYHGFAGQYLVRDLPWILKVRVNSSMEDRLRIVMDRDRVSRSQAKETIEKLDDERKKWARKLYGIDPSDSTLYDLVVQTDPMTVDDAVSVLCDVAQMKPFRITTQFKTNMEDLALAAQVRTYLTDIRPSVEVCSEGGMVYVSSETPVSEDSSLVKRIGMIAAKVAGLKGIEIVSAKDAGEHAVCLPRGGERPSKGVDTTFFTELG